jgi:predicted dehydrogenase
MSQVRAQAPWTPPVNVVLVGCGAVARRYYIPALIRLAAGGWIGTVRLFDLYPMAAAEVSSPLPAASVAQVWEEVLEGAEELAIVASPPVAHAEQVRALLEHGKHILCEKPFTLDRAAGESLVDLARERGLVCAAGMVRRFSRSACLIRQLLSDERPTRVVWHEGSPFRWPVDSAAYFARGAGNELLWDVGSHVIDLLIWWLGVPRNVSCRDDAMGGTAANCLLELEWPNACSGEVRLSREYDVAGGLIVERPSGVLTCRDVTEAEVLRGFRETVAPEFE